MKTKIPHLILALGIFAAQPASAADTLITFSTFDASGTGTGYNIVGGGSGGASLSTTVGDPTTFSFTLSGTDLDNGGVNDTLTFDLVYTIYTGSTYDGNDVTLGPTVALDALQTHYFQNYIGDPDTNSLSVLVKVSG